MDKSREADSNVTLPTSTITGLIQQSDNLPSGRRGDRSMKNRVSFGDQICKHGTFESKNVRNDPTCDKMVGENGACRKFLHLLHRDEELAVSGLDS